MQDDIAKSESELTRFFAGLDAGLNSLREVRTVYDEQIAFEFNMLRLFEPGETKISEILAFFLDPKKPHGQKSAFLRTFLEHFKLKPSDQIRKLLSADETISVKPEDRTKDNRRIDITVFFKNARFAIGIENKINAQDQDNQVQHYSKELDGRTEGNYVLLYLSKKGTHPSKISISESDLKILLEKEKIRCVSYMEIGELLVAVS